MFFFLGMESRVPIEVLSIYESEVQEGSGETRKLVTEREFSTHRVKFTQSVKTKPYSSI